MGEPIAVLVTVTVATWGTRVDVGGRCVALAGAAVSLGDTMVAVGGRCVALAGAALSVGGAAVGIGAAGVGVGISGIAMRVGLGAQPFIAITAIVKQLTKNLVSVLMVMWPFVGLPSVAF